MAENLSDGGLEMLRGPIADDRIYARDRFETLLRIIRQIGK